MNNISFASFVEGAGRARLADEPLPHFADSERPLGEDQGYAVQAELAGWFRRHGRGDVAGYKVGATTVAMQQRLGVAGPAYGHVMAGNVLSSGARIAGRHLCETGVECELAIRLASDIPLRKTSWTRKHIAESIKAVIPAIEIVENRYGDFRSMGIGTLVADDFFHKACVLGAPVEDWTDISLPDVTGVIAVNGTSVGTGRGADVLGHPLEVIAWLANTLAMQGRTLKANDIIFTGSMTPVHWVADYPSRVEIEISGIGSCVVELLPA